jgi:hypothetical protein
LLISEVASSIVHDQGIHRLVEDGVTTMILYYVAVILPMTVSPVKAGRSACMSRSTSSCPLARALTAASNVSAAARCSRVLPSPRSKTVVSWLNGSRFGVRCPEGYGTVSPHCVWRFSGELIYASPGSLEDVGTGCSSESLE